MTTVIEQLTDAQGRALATEGDVLVAAAAGSGKTRVLTARIVRGVVEQGVPLDSIVAVTFTEKAAAEVRQRVASQLLALGRGDGLAALEAAPIGTIHSLCARLLREHAHSAGLDPGFAVLDAAQVAYLQQRALAEVLAQCDHDDALAAVRVRYGDERIAAYLTGALDLARQRLDGKVAFAGGPVADAGVLGVLYERFIAIYEAARRAAGGLDFDDLQRRALDLLAIDDVRTRVRCAVQRVLVDEFQDCNELQCAILEAIGSGCMFMVGDQWQGIYRFRGADISVFRRRWRDLGDAAIGMRDNFRSTPALLDVVNTMFGVAFGEAYDPVLPGRALVPQPESPAHGPHDNVACELLLVPGSGDSSRRAEADAVAQRIAALVHDGAAPGDVAILLARQTHAAVFEQALERHGIPSVRAATRGYWMQQQVRDVVSLLQWVRNRSDDRAALSVLASPLVDLQWRDLLRLRTAGETMWQALVADDDPRSRHAVQLHGQLEAIAQNGSLVDLVEHTVHGTGYAERVLAGDDGRRRYANMRKLVELAASAHDLGVGDVGRFLQLVEAQGPTAVEGEAALADEAGTAVRIMTVHAAKGLEFPYVFVCDCANVGSRIPPRLLAATDGTLAFVAVDEHGVADIVPDELEALRLHERAEQQHEERRLLYVALTRAERRLCVSGVVPRKRSTGEPAPVGPLAWMLGTLDLDLPAIEAVGDWQHPSLPLRVRVVQAEARREVAAEIRSAPCLVPNSAR